jgi:hypothetical protein
MTMRRAAIALILAALACGGDPAQTGGPTTPADNTPPPAAVMGLVVHVVQSPDQTTRAIGTQYQWALSRAGFQVAADPGEPHDVEIRLAASKEVVPTFWQVQVNGRAQVKLRVHVVAQIMGLSPPARVDVVQTEFEMNEGDDPDPAAMGKLVVAYAKSPNLARWAGTHTQPEANAPPNNNANANGADDADWYKLNPVLCKVPIKLDACDAVRAYLAKWPQGSHAADARATLDAAEPTLERLQKDENDWQAIHSDECRKKRTRDACAGVEVYLHRYPAGLHAEEAKKLTP